MISFLLVKSLLARKSCRISEKRANILNFVNTEWCFGCVAQRATKPFFSLLYHLANFSTDFVQDVCHKCFNVATKQAVLTFFPIIITCILNTKPLQRKQYAYNPKSVWLYDDCKQLEYCIAAGDIGGAVLNMKLVTQGKCSIFIFAFFRVGSWQAVVLHC